ncbi:MAG TPA: FlgD immunoglobulin-like domain containing protein, partial [Draconibacterium sp.]|nr:FlgD immunoglobulin-like domain containing protein [Draconibacterium sp.]
TVTTISFELKGASHIKISIINLLGQEVCTIINKDLQPGEYAIHWDGRDTNGTQVTEGIYFCQMESDLQLVQVGKIIFKPML